MSGGLFVVGQILSPSAPLTLPFRFWASPLRSCISPSARRLSLSVALPMACLVLPMASLARPLALSLNAPTGNLLGWHEAASPHPRSTNARSEAHTSELQSILRNPYGACS